MGVWTDFHNLPKSAAFKTIGYSPGFLVELGQFRTFSKSLEMYTSNPFNSQKSICKDIGGVSGCLERFPELTKIRHG